MKHIMQPQSFAVGKTARHKESFVAIRLSIGCYSWIKEYNVDIMVCSNLSENYVPKT